MSNFFKITTKGKIFTGNPMSFFKSIPPLHNRYIIIDNIVLSYNLVEQYASSFFSKHNKNVVKNLII